MPPRASRRRRWPTSTSRSSTTTRSSRHQQGRPAQRRPDKVRKEIEDIVGLPADDAVLTSAKTGIGIDEVLKRFVTRIPPPHGDRDAPLKAMLVDSWYDPYLGVVILIRVVDGAIRKGQMVKFMIGGTSTSSTASAPSAPRSSTARARPRRDRLHHAQIKDISETRVGDTITDVRSPALEALPGFKEVQPVVFCGLFPVDAADFEKLRESISKLRLNDASFSFEMETSARTGLRLPLRLPRAPPPRDHPGAPHPRI
jgi:GTP-binding protein LepA